MKISEKDMGRRVVVNGECDGDRFNNNPGKIVGIDKMEYIQIAVEFDEQNPNHFHTCLGMAKKGHGFWVSNNCPKCGHSGRVVYTPDLLIGPIESECLSVKNPLRKFSPCYYEWSFAADDNKKDEIRALLQIAKRQEELWEEYQQNRIKLGYNK